MFNHKMETVKQQIAKIITVIFGIKLILHDIRLKKWLQLKFLGIQHVLHFYGPLN